MTTRLTPTGVDVFGLIEQFKPDSYEELIPDYAEDGPVSILTGMTYDSNGEPADALLQVAGAVSIADRLEAQGYETETTLLIADSDVFVEGSPESRYRVLSNFASNYAPDNLDISVEKTSELEGDDFDALLQEFEDEVRNNRDFASTVLDTVPERYRKGDPVSDSEYTLNQLASMAILDPDIKVGPDREELYDQVARTGRYMDLADREVEMTGAYIPAVYSTEGEAVIPYKARSGSGSEKRILLGDEENEIERKLRQVPKDQLDNMAALNKFLSGEMTSEPSDIAASLSKHFQVLHPVQRKSVFDIG